MDSMKRERFLRLQRKSRFRLPLRFQVSIGCFSGEVADSQGFIALFGQAGDFLFERSDKSDGGFSFRHPSMRITVIRVLVRVGNSGHHRWESGIFWQANRLS